MVVCFENDMQQHLVEAVPITESLLKCGMTTLLHHVVLVMADTCWCLAELHSGSVRSSAHHHGRWRQH